jgi:pimeloyl-ACP methyl ester carboxylesterase
MTDGAAAWMGGSVAFRDSGGPRPAVILVHGLGCNLAHWERVAPLLRERYRLVSVDLPFHGASTAPVDYSFDHDLGAVDAVREYLDVDRPAVVGHSYGGVLAVALGASRPSSYRTIINLDGSGFVDAESGAEVLPDELPGELSDEELVDAGDADWLEREVSRDVDEVTSFGLRVGRDDEIIRRAFQLGDDGLWHRSPTFSRFVEIARALRTLRLLSVYAASSCRTVTVFAERRYAPNEAAAEVARRHADRFRAALVDAGAELDSVPTGHYPHVEAPELTAERFGAWLGF